MNAELPRLAVAYGDRSVSLFTMAAAAADLCDLVVLLDTSEPGVSTSARLARKVGIVVDMAGLDDTAVAAALDDVHVSGLLTYFDAGMVRLASLAAHLGLTFHSPDVARALTDKAEQRRRIAAAGMPGPLVEIITADEDAQDVASRITYPAVLKPQHGDGSRHTYRLTGREDLSRFLRGMSSREPMVVEQLLVGRDSTPFASYLSVESFVRDGIAEHVTTTGRFPPAEHFRETGFFVPAAISDALRSDLFAETERVLAAIGVRDGACHTEFVLTDDGPRLLEINGRLGGGVPEMVALAGGPALHPAAMRWALGAPLGFDTPVELHAVGYRFLVQPPAGVHRVVGQQGLDELSRSPGVADVALHHELGTVIDTREGSRSFVFSAAGTVPNHEQLLEAAARITDPSYISYGPVN